MVRKDLECIVEYMRHKNKDIVIDITTNALLLTDETIKTLQACGIDEISVSLDGPEAVYKMSAEKMRTTGSYYIIFSGCVTAASMWTELWF